MNSKLSSFLTAMPKVIRATTVVCASLAIGVSTPLLAQHSGSSGVARLDMKPDALLQIDMYRGAVVERIVATWGKEIPAEQIESFASKLRALRADQLLAASLSGSFDGVLELLHGERGTYNATDRYSPALASTASSYANNADINAALANGSVKISLADRSKAVGEADRDLVYTPVTPCRLFDTRAGQPSALGTAGGIFPNQTQRTIAPAGACEIPTANVKALMFGFTALTNNPPVLGIISFMKPAAPLTALAATWTGGQWVTGTYISPTDGSGAFDTFVGNLAPMAAHVVVDVVGYFMPPGRNGDGLRVDTNQISPSMIGGSSANATLSTVRGATIAGGGAAAGTDPDYGGEGPNRATDHYGFVGGGVSNRAGNDNTDISDAGFATVVGGRGNVASGALSSILGGFDNAANGYIGTIAGGEGNRVSDAWSFVGGGRFNLASGIQSVIAGGNSNTSAGTGSAVLGGSNNSAAGPGASVLGGTGNTAAGQNSVVLGGINNLVAGAGSVVAGIRANAPFAGCFVWGDSLDAVVDCNAADQFVARARGGVQLITGGTTGNYTGAVLPAGTGAWAVLSDRSMKTDISPVRARDVLDKVIGLPISTWRYKAESGFVKHIGPMSQDLYRTFGFGASDKSITTVDADGIALAAIQGLNHKLVAESRAKDAKIFALERANETIQRELAAIKKKLGL
jgi:Chaperone of endosialidase